MYQANYMPDNSKVEFMGWGTLYMTKNV